MKKKQIALTPEKLIPAKHQGWITDSGIFYRKGTTVATFSNVEIYQSEVDKGITDINSKNFQTAINDQQFITNLVSVGLDCSLFPPIDWFSNEKLEGRMLPALLLLQQFPDRITDEIHSRLLELQKKVSPVTQTLISETLEAYDNFNKKKKEVEKYLAFLYEKYVEALNEKNMEWMAEIWLDSEESALIVPSKPKVIFGKKNILECTKGILRNFKIKYQVTDMQFSVDLIKGIANIYTQNALEVAFPQVSIYKDKTVPNFALINCQFSRLETPSCRPTILGDFDWNIGDWKIKNWSEVFPLESKK